MPPGRRAATVLLVAIVLIVATAAYGVIAIDRPRVESVDSEWGTVTSERTEVETRIGVEDPFLLRVGDAAADVSYSVSLNDVEIATETENRAQFDDGTVTVSTWVDNDEIPAWWATHVDNGETTTVRIDPDITVRYAGVRLPADGVTRTGTVQTDLLAPLQENRSREYRAAGRTLFVVEETDAQWGNATPNRTPIDASATVTNPTSLPIPITEIGYTVRLNDRVVGQGVAGEQIVLPPDETRTIEANAAIDTEKLDEWWPTHVRNNETSTLSVAFTATVEYGGVEREVPLDVLSYERTFQTDLIGAGSNATDSVEDGTNDSPELAA
ncbi:LEA type 2 family protein [Natrinema salifodinae]|uniref:LEA14-like dessication related protein n=1 Tax=Natrinema salifodinae TaxID=1202768 RepID=A0A1I0PS93_9EURY|nr:LEA type 2 family protein [Natrinema salifodinae]SEW17156.1 LEA14-like dessication related protein [Natrinema salifodinae]